jgi:hypothetical protein
MARFQRACRLVTPISLFAPKSYRLVFLLAAMPALAALAVFAWGAPHVQLPRAECGFAATVWQLVLLLGLYAAFYALTESAERALVADFVPLD